jgi:hypothetical protein
MSKVNASGGLRLDESTLDTLRRVQLTQTAELFQVAREARGRMGDLAVDLAGLIGPVSDVAAHNRRLPEHLDALDALCYGDSEPR